VCDLHAQDRRIRRTVPPRESGRATLPGRPPGSDAHRLRNPAARSVPEHREWLVRGDTDGDGTAAETAKIARFEDLASKNGDRLWPWSAPVVRSDRSDRGPVTLPYARTGVKSTLCRKMSGAAASRFLCEQPKAPKLAPCGQSPVVGWRYPWRRRPWPRASRCRRARACDQLTDGCARSHRKPYGPEFTGEFSGCTGEWGRC
jgi:hypothetical protein